MSDYPSFPECCAEIYKRELEKEYKREIKEDAYLKQDAFGKRCRARGKAMSYTAEIAVDNFKGLCIALHREKHGDDVSEEISELSAVMAEEDIQTATDGITVYGWWKN